MLSFADVVCLRRMPNLAKGDADQLVGGGRGSGTGLFRLTTAPSARYSRNTGTLSCSACCNSTSSSFDPCKQAAVEHPCLKMSLPQVRHALRKQEVQHAWCLIFLAAIELLMACGASGTCDDLHGTCGLSSQ